MDIQFERPKEGKIHTTSVLFCERLVRSIIYSMVFLVPLFFLPYTFDFFDFNKQYLLWALISLTFFIWIFKMVILEKTVVLKRTPLDIPVLMFLGANILTAIFSVDTYISFWGSYGNFSESFINIFMMVILYFVVVNNF